MLFPDKRLSQKIELTEARSNLDFVTTRAKLFPQTNATSLSVGGAYAMFDGVNSPLTQIFGLGMFREVTNDQMDQLEQFYKQRLSAVYAEVSPLADASALNILNARKYQPMEFSNTLYQPLNEQREKFENNISTRIIEAGEETIWAETLAEGWRTEMSEHFDFLKEIGEINTRTTSGLPFLAEIDDKAVAAGMLFIYDDVALLAGASTIAEYRGRGAQSALLHARLRYATTQGCSLAIMGTLPGSMSQKNAEKNGFKVAYTRTKWHLPL